MPVNAQQQTEPVSLVVKHLDYQRLVPLIRASDLALADALDQELSRADIVADRDLPSDAVAMHSQVTFRDLATQADTTVTLVFPEEADLEKGRISVLSPIGTALLGLRTVAASAGPCPTAGSGT